MVEVALLTLFLTFFKSILNRSLGFGIISVIFSFSTQNTFADIREITLYPSQDIRVFENSDLPTKTVRLGLTESIVNLKFVPCYIILNQIPILYSVLQSGVSCGTNISNRDSLSVDIIPEVNYKGANETYALTIGFNNNFDLTAGKRNWLFQSSIYYKFWDNKLQDSPYNIDTRQLLQLWGNVFDSNISIGFLHNDEKGQEESHSSFSSYFYYKQSLPLAWRQIGGARNTAALEYKAIGASFRKEFFNFFIFGIGVAFWTLTFDGIRASGPLPEIYIALDI
ncbi:hypothetical protein [Fluviispira multicolorata]|uniref:Uncharacterized protein n=1 Tax=Fluviispira multicolorata TaxID=2654512 RepID=A0A833JEI7_9BACT|nr:hypothetical protein [Fluviispira multicolorata]KAB8029904.1 hypothetical protein GCL57_10230 [Fluviispira multicolorata]